MRKQYETEARHLLSFSKHIRLIGENLSEASVMKDYDENLRQAYGLLTGPKVFQLDYRSRDFLQAIESFKMSHSLFGIEIIHREMDSNERDVTQKDDFLLFEAMTRVLRSYEDVLFG